MYSYNDDELMTDDLTDPNTVHNNTGITPKQGGTMVNQRKATVDSILFTLKERGINYEVNGQSSVSEFLTAEDKKNITDSLCKGFMSRTIHMSDDSFQKYSKSETEMRKYVIGLVNNWIRKAPELNGGNTYQAKNPGSRAGAGDEQIKALKALIKTVDDAAVKQEIQQAINERLAEIKPAKTVEINADALPEHLKYLVG